MKCNIARDLLVLYFDGVCSDETRKQLEEHMEHCENCRKIKENLESEQNWSDEKQDWEQPITPFKKVRKKIQRKNVMIAVCVAVLLIFAGVTSFLAYGQIARKGMSFETVYDAVRFQYIGKQFALGNIEPLYEILSNGYILDDEESGVVRLAYTSNEEYDNDMKAAILEKYHQYFDNRNLKFRGIEEIGYLKTPKTQQSSTLYIALKFEGGMGDDRIEYYIGLYKTLDGQYLVTDYFGNPYLTYGSGDKDGSDVTESEMAKEYHTEDSLFSCLPNELSDIDLYLARHAVMTSGQRAMNGDTLLAQNGQMRFSIMSEEDLAAGTYSLSQKINDKLDVLAEEGYYLTDITWDVKTYDKVRHLYRYQINMVLTHKESLGNIVVTADCYRISDKFIYIPETYKVYGDEK